MKVKAFTLSCCSAAVLLSGIVSHVFAAPMGGSNRGLEHGVGSMNPKKWSVGVYTVDRERDVDSPYFANVKSRKTMAYLGYDWSLYGYTRWITTYACFGNSKTRIGRHYAETDPEYGVGLNFNLLDQEINDPTLFENRLRLRGGCQFTRTGTDEPETGDWDEIFLHATLGLVNDIEGNKLYLPNSIAVYGGPIFSWLGNSSSFSNEGMFGYTLGLEVYYTESISLDVGLEVMDYSDLTAGVHIRF
jgi:hypothetical protein